MVVAESRRVVIADDEEPMRLLLRALLELAPEVELIAEACDGQEAVELVARTQPSLALLDVMMPRLDGIQAAEVIRAQYPATGLLLHTAQPGDEVRRRAEAIGVPLIDKLDLTDSVEDVLAVARKRDDRQAPPDAIQTLVLMAVAARTGDAVVVVSAEREVVFYNSDAAELLGLPLPARRLPLDSLWRPTHAVYPDGRPRPGEERPLGIVLRTRKRHSDEVLWRIGEGDVLRRHRVTAIPFFDKAGTFLGVGNYMTPLEAAPVAPRT